MSATANSEPSTILITGANSGIGLAASKLVALKESTKRVILGEFVRPLRDSALWSQLTFWTNLSNAPRRMPQRGESHGGQGTA